MDFGGFVVGEVGVGQAGGGELGADGSQVGRAFALDAHENVRGGVVAVTVVEFGDVAAAQNIDELEEAAGLLGNRHGKNTFVAFAQLAALGNVAQAVEIDVGTAGDGNQGLAMRLLAGDIGFEAGQGQRAGGLADAAGVVENIFERAADGVGVYCDDFI